MLDIKSRSQLAEATADMIRACALATARAASAPMFQGMSFWSWMLRSSATRPAPAFPAVEGRMAFRPPWQGDHERWVNPASGEHVTVDAQIRSRHTANGILKEAGIGKKF